MLRVKLELCLSIVKALCSAKNELALALNIVEALSNAKSQVWALFEHC